LATYLFAMLRFASMRIMRRISNTNNAQTHGEGFDTSTDVPLIKPITRFGGVDASVGDMRLFIVLLIASCSLKDACLFVKISVVRGEGVLDDTELQSKIDNFSVKIQPISVSFNDFLTFF